MVLSALQVPRMTAYRLVSMRAQQLAPQLQRAGCLPAVHFPICILCLLRKCVAQQTSKLPDVRECMFVSGISIQPEHLHDACAQKMDVWHAGCGHKLGIPDKDTVHALHCSEQ